MKVNEVMTRNVEFIQPNDSLQMAARKMRDQDIGFLPVYEGDELIGVVTDRDIAVRAVADGMNPEAIIGRELVTSPVVYCFEDQNVEEAARLMSDNQVRRLVVVDRKNNQPVGVISLGDLAGTVKEKTAGKTLESIIS
ncbi:MAG TPA: CBS domain-containing protein [Anaerolineales bacterium]|nr:CBS domain-containing protein [Anaerolineales bacterium]